MVWGANATTDASDVVDATLGADVASYLPDDLLVKVDIDEGHDPTPTRDRAVEYYARLRSEGTISGPSCGNEGTMQADYAAWQASRGVDPRESYHRAVEAFDRALAAMPDNEMTLVNRGVACLNLGDSEIDRGGDPVTPMRSGTPRARTPRSDP